MISITEINSLYSQRPIVEKHASYAFYHPWTEAFAGVISDVPVKFLIAVCFNVILYFLAGLRTEPSQFFIFFLFVFVSMLTMSSIFRCLAAVTSALSQAMALAGVMVLAIVIYTGFTLPRPYEHPWMKWISWINPIAYAFEAILVNEVHGRRFPCANLVPSPQFQSGSSFICSVAGAVPGVNDVLGDDWVKSSYGYSYTHIWRNLGKLACASLLIVAKGRRLSFCISNIFSRPLSSCNRAKFINFILSGSTPFSTWTCAKICRTGSKGRCGGELRGADLCGV